MLKRAAKQFCLNTSLHGYRFIVLPKRTVLEKLFWILIITITIIITIATVTYAWLSKKKDKLVTITDTIDHPIWNFYFPAVTICNFNQISKAKAHRVVKQMRIPRSISGDEMVENLKLLLHLLPSDSSSIRQWNLTRLQDIIELNNMTSHDLFKRVKPSCSEMFEFCKWKGDKSYCDMLFEPIITETGFCCSFNYFGLKHSKFQRSLSKRAPQAPRRIASCGFKNALEVIIQNSPNDYFASLFPSHGYRILVHHPFSNPNWGTPNMLVEMKTLIHICITPELTKCSKGIADLSVEDRKCYFSKEKSLQYFRYYTYHNCMTECRAMSILRHCGCIPFFNVQPIEKFQDYRICTLRDSTCLSLNKNIIWSSVPGKNNLSHQAASEMECSCLPDCEFSIYPMESTSGILSRKYASSKTLLFGDVVITNESVIRVYFNDLSGVKNTTSIIYQWHSLFALFGGILSLLTGFSFADSFQLVHYFIIQPVIQKWQGRKKTISKKKSKSVKSSMYDNQKSSYTSSYTYFVN